MHFSFPLILFKTKRRRNKKLLHITNQMMLEKSLNIYLLIIYHILIIIYR